MFNLRFGRDALGVSVAAAMLAACGGSAQFPNPTAQTASANAQTVGHVASPSNISPNRLRSSNGKTEHLRAPSVHEGSCGGDGLETRCYFFVKSGTATGPFPGTFNAFIKFFSSCQPPFGCGSSFYEQFTITSGTSKFKGKINGSGGPPAVFEYKTNNGYSGKVKIYSVGPLTRRHDFNEKFYGM